MNNIKTILLVLDNTSVKSTEVSNELLLEKVIQKISDINTSYEFICLLVALIVLIIIVLLLINNKKIVNKKSQEEYKKNERNKKYINQLYIELGPYNENLRYLFFEKKWKKRIRKELKMIFNTNVGKMLKKRCKIHFYNYYTFKGISKTLFKIRSYLDNKRKMEIKDDHNLMYYLHQNSFYLEDSIDRLSEYVETMKHNVILILGKAGSGKTNLLTYYAKTIICKYKGQCIYIDSKDVIDNQIESKFFSYFYTQFFLNEKRKNLVSILLIFKCVFNQKIIVIIDALNENSNPSFQKNLCHFINEYSKYKNIKIIISSRSEFYKLKFKENFDEYLEEKVNIKIVPMEISRVSESIHERMYNKYKKYYNFSGQTTNGVRKILYDSPILMRIFFNCYRDSNQLVTNINKSKIFSEYISKLSKTYRNLGGTLKKIVEKMIKNDKYDYVCIDEIKININEIEVLMSEEVLLTKTIVENEGEVNEEKKEAIQITYDEIRDYLITNVVIEKYSKSIIKICSFIKKIIDDKSPILEGVLTNLYVYYKKMNNNVCKYILEQNIPNYNNYNNDLYNDMKLELIFSAKEEIKIFEEEYILGLKYIMPKDIAKIIVTCTYNTVYGFNPSIKFIVREIKKFISYENTPFDFSRIHVDFYKGIISTIPNNLFDKLEIREYISIIKKLIYFLEENYEENTF